MRLKDCGRDTSLADPDQSASTRPSVRGRDPERGRRERLSNIFPNGKKQLKNINNTIRKRVVVSIPPNHER